MAVAQLMLTARIKLAHDRAPARLVSRAMELHAVMSMNARQMRINAARMPIAVTMLDRTRAHVNQDSKVRMN